jgi:hypothetical protein
MAAVGFLRTKFVVAETFPLIFLNLKIFSREGCQPEHSLKQRRRKDDDDDSKHNKRRRREDNDDDSKHNKLS